MNILIFMENNYIYFTVTLNGYTFALNLNKLSMNELNRIKVVLVEHKLLCGDVRTKEC